jgi:hypothetical protein
MHLFPQRDYTFGIPRMLYAYFRRAFHPETALRNYLLVQVYRHLKSDFLSLLHLIPTTYATQPWVFS